MIFGYIRKLSLQTILSLFLSFMILCVVLITGTAAYQIFESNMVDQLANARLDLLGQVSGRITTLEHVIVSFSDLYFYNEPLKSILLNLNIDEASYSEVQTELKKLNESYGKALVTNGLELEYAILFEDYSYHSSYNSRDIKMSDYNEVLWRYDFLKGNTERAWLPTYTDVWDKEGENVFSYARAITDKKGDTYGYFLVNAGESILRKTYIDSLNQNNSIYIINSDGRVVSHPDSNIIGLYFYRMDRLNNMFQDRDYAIIEKGGEKYLFSRYFNYDLGWTILEETPMRIVLKPIDGVRNGLILACIIMILVGSIVASIVARKLALPLKALSNDLKRVAISEEKVEFNNQSWRELDEICIECNYMNNRIVTLVENVRITETQIHKTELNFLYEQINPHFIHNTLFSIKCLVAMNRNDEAENMITEFISFLGTILRPSDQIITIEQEMYILNKYAGVLKFRYGDQIEIKLRCPEKYMNVCVPKLLLQPLVENSIFHGFPERQKGVISIDVSGDDDKVFIIVSDNGVGFDEGKLGNMNKISSENSSYSIGIKNVHNRIQLIFGKQYGLKITSQPGEGTKATVVIPNKTM